MPLTQGDVGKQIVKTNSIWVPAIQAGLEALEWNLKLMSVTTTQDKNLMDIAVLPRFLQIGKKNAYGREIDLISPKSITTLFKISDRIQKRKKGENMVAQECCFTFA